MAEVCTPSFVPKCETITLKGRNESYSIKVIVVKIPERCSTNEQQHIQYIYLHIHVVTVFTGYTVVYTA